MTDPTRAKWVQLTGGRPAFNIHSNYSSWFELGSEEGDDVWLRGEVVGEEQEFVFNGRLFPPGGSHAGTVIDNFPKSPDPRGWTRRQALDGEGYDLVDDNGEILFGYRVAPDRICDVTVNLYRRDGTEAAHAGQGGLVTHGVMLRPFGG